jgi:hypothetical protein
MYYDDDLYPEALKALFLDVAVEMVPELCAELQGEPFRLYKCLPLDAAPHKWGGYSRARNTLPFQQMIRAIEAWATNWNLEAEWCKAAAYFTLQMWSDLRKSTNFILIQPFSKSIARLDPPDGLPMYRQEFGRQAYLKTLEDTAKETIKNNPLLKCAPVAQRTAFIVSILESPTVSRYCDEVDALRNFSHKNKRKLKQHLEWAVRVHIRRESLKDIATERQLAGKRGNTEPAISMAVSEILTLIELQ